MILSRAGKWGSTASRSREVECCVGVAVKLMQTPPNHVQPCPARDQDLPGSPPSYFLFGKGPGESLAREASRGYYQRSACCRSPSINLREPAAGSLSKFFGSQLPAL